MKAADIRAMKSGIAHDYDGDVEQVILDAGWKGNDAGMAMVLINAVLERVARNMEEEAA